MCEHIKNGIYIICKTQPMCLKLSSTHLDVQTVSQAPLAGGWSCMCIRNNKYNDGIVLYCGCIEMRAMHMQILDLRRKSYFSRRSNSETLKIGIYAKNQSSTSIFVKLRFGLATHVKLPSGPQYFQNFLTGPQSILLVLQIIRILKLVL